MHLNSVDGISFKSKIARTTIHPGEWIDEWKNDRGYILSYQKKSQRNKDTCILFVHGGGFSEDQPRTPSYDSFGYILTNGTSFDTYIPDYTLAPEKTFPYQLEQLLLIANKLSNSYKHIIIGGDSAGGTMALQMCLINPKLFYSAFVISAWVDLHCDGHSYYSRAWNDKLKTGDPIFKDSPQKEIKDSRKEALTYLGKKSLFKHPIANPINATQDMLKKLPPFLFLIGDNEVIRDGTLHLAARAQQVNDNIFSFLYEGMWHDWVLYSQKTTKIMGTHGIDTIISFCNSQKRGNSYKFVPINNSSTLTLNCNIII